MRANLGGCHPEAAMGAVTCHVGMGVGDALGMAELVRKHVVQRVRRADVGSGSGTARWQDTYGLGRLIGADDRHGAGGEHGENGRAARLIGVALYGPTRTAMGNHGMNVTRVRCCWLPWRACRRGCSWMR